MTVGVVGLGNLGSRLAERLGAAGFDLAVNDLERGRGDGLVAAGAAWRETPAALAAGADVVVTCLPSPTAVAVALEGPAGILEGIRAGSTWIDTSTSDRRVTARLAEAVAARGADALEAPVTGGVHLAAAGKLTVIVGGDADVFERRRDVLAALGDRIFHVGRLGSATALKVVTNMLAFIHLAAAGEALMLARRAGLDLGQAFEVIRASSGTSFVLETEGQVILNGSYDIGFTVDLALKDLGFARELGEELGVPLELEAVVERAFERARDAYGGDAWSPTVVKLLEDALDTDLRAPGYPPRLVG